MAQVFANREKIGALSKTGNTTVQLSASVITLGAKQYTTGNLVCDITISGAGGIDTGSVAANSTYYVFAVVDSSVVKIICSLSNIVPTGFTLSKLVGGFFSNYQSQVGDLGVLDNNSKLKNETTRKQQIKWLKASKSAGGDMSDLTFNNLTIGKKYRLTGVIRAETTNTQYMIYTMEIKNGATRLRYIQNHDASVNGLGNQHIKYIKEEFTANATTLTTDLLVTTGTIIFGNAVNDKQNQTEYTLEEIIDTEETTDWT